MVQDGSINHLLPGAEKTNRPILLPSIYWHPIVLKLTTCTIKGSTETPQTTLTTKYHHTICQTTFKLILTFLSPKNATHQEPNNKYNVPSYMDSYWRETKYLIEFNLNACICVFGSGKYTIMPMVLQ